MYTSDTVLLYCYEYGLLSISNPNKRFLFNNFDVISILVRRHQSFVEQIKSYTCLLYVLFTKHTTVRSFNCCIISCAEPLKTWKWILNYYVILHHRRILILRFALYNFVIWYNFKALVVSSF